MAGFERPWWIVGGWSIEAFTGVLREHEDVDLSILACDVPALRAHVGDAWNLWSMDGGTMRPLNDTFPEVLNVESQIWVRRSALDPWIIDLPITPDRDGLWTNKRDPDHVVPLEEATWVAADGIRYLRPEITLLYKAVLHRPKDDRDLAVTWPLLPPDEAGLAARGPRAALPRTPVAGADVTRTLGKAMTVYLDHAATTPMLPAAIEALTTHLADVGNPNSLHASGRHARRVVEESRETIAQALNCRPGEVVFTSGGTESDNLALKGIFWARRAADPRRTRILTSAVEHHAVLDPLLWLAEAEGVEVEFLPVDSRGRLDVAALRAAVERDPDSVALVSVMWANNEVGTLQPVEEAVAIAAALRHPRAHRRRAGGRRGAGRLRRLRGGRAHLHRAQARRSLRRRRAGRPPRGRGERPRARRRAGARHPQRHPGRPRHRRPGRRGRAVGQAAGRARDPGRRAA